MVKLADRLDCTACMNCLIECNANAISFPVDKMGNIYPEIDGDKCVECNQCSRACPALKSVKLHEPDTCYGAYLTDVEARRFSASGGFATGLYMHCVEHGIAFSGVYFNNETLTAHYRMGSSSDDIYDFRNSKYTFSFMGEVAIEVADVLKRGGKACFVGLPCHVAAVLRYCEMQSVDMDKLLTIDLICHGIPSHEYLQDHVRKSFGVDSVDSLLFRDPAHQTSKFYLKIDYQREKRYEKPVESADNYQIGYHNATIYRPNCYNCHYASSERAGDITLGDFNGIGKIAPFNGNLFQEKLRGISCVLVNTPRGAELMNSLLESGILEATERPVEEAIGFERQLQAPSVPSRYRRKFEQLYPLRGFTGTCNRIFLTEKLKRPIVRFAKDRVKSMIGRE